MPPRPTIAFDLDGTLVDSAPDLVAALNVVLAETGLGPVGLEHARNLVGGGARLMIERGLAQHGAKFSPAETDRMLARFLAYYEHHIADHSRPCPDAKIVLEELVRAGAILLVCTNKLERYSVKLLDAMGLASYFTLVAGADTFPVRKPNPGHLLLRSSGRAVTRRPRSWLEIQDRTSRPHARPASP
jgi:phosphoglycolate phosphatase